MADAKRESRSDSKPMLVKVSTSWCTYCVKMQLETFDDQAVVKHVEECFVPLAIDGDKHKQLIQRLGIDTFPTTLVVSPNMRVVKKIVGFRSANQLQAELVGVCQEEQNALPKSKTSRPRKSVFGISDPVSIQLTGIPLNGSPKLTTVHAGFRLAFHNKANLDEFLRNTQRYWPVVNGMCVVSVLDRGDMKYGRPDISFEYQGRKWLFATAEHRELFQANPRDYVSRLRDFAKSKRNKRSSANSISSAN